MREHVGPIVSDGFLGTILNEADKLLEEQSCELQTYQARQTPLFASHLSNAAPSKPNRLIETPAQGRGTTTPY